MCIRDRSQALRAFASATGIPVSDTQAGKGAINFDHPLAVGGVGSTGGSAANTLAREADLVIGIGTRYSDFTTASHTIFANPEVKFVNINVMAFDAAKHSATMVVADAKEALVALATELQGWSTEQAYQDRAAELDADWQRIVDTCYAPHDQPPVSYTHLVTASAESPCARDSWCAARRAGPSGARSPSTTVPRSMRGGARRGRPRTSDSPIPSAIGCR